MNSCFKGTGWQQEINSHKHLYIWRYNVNTNTQKENSKSAMETRMLSWMNTARKYGARFQNINIIYKNASFTLQTIEENKTFEIYIPSNLLINIDDITITNSAHHIKDDLSIQTDKKEMIDEYLDLILSSQRIDTLQSQLHDFINLPQELRNELMNFSLHYQNINKSRQELKMKLLYSRIIIYKGQKVILPFIDFGNHNFRNGHPFHHSEDAISIHGMAKRSKEIFTIYNRMNDAFGYMHSYLFVPKVLNILSMNFTISTIPDLHISIERDTAHLFASEGNLMLPSYRIENNKIILKSLWIGSLHRPLKPYQSFKKLWEDQLHRNDTQRVYSIIKGLNIKKLSSILRLAYKAPRSSATEIIIESALQHLTLIGGSFEVIKT